MACGRFEGFWEFGLHTWDTAAGSCWCARPAGVVTGFDGRPYRLGDREMMASNGRVHEEMKAVAASVAERIATEPLT